MKVAVILPAAGLGTRMGKGSAEKTGTSRKQFMLLEGSPILAYTVRKFAASPRVAEIVVAVRARRPGVGRRHAGRGVSAPIGCGWWRAATAASSPWRTRWRTLKPDTDLVAVHDAVRPFIDLETIHAVFDEAAETGAAIVAVPAVDTVKQVVRGTGHVRVRSTLPREKLVMAQTPQVFRYEVIQKAFQSAMLDGFTGTDESSLVERMDVEVSVVPGSDRNIKITKPGDMHLARLFLQEETEESKR